MSHQDQVVTVCLPQDIPVDQLATAAARTVPADGAATPTAIFATQRRWRTRRLLNNHNHTAASGPLALLDLQATAATGRRIHQHRWHVWQQAVTATRPAQPYWQFLDRHHHNPKTYSLAQAQAQFLAQPRVAAMNVYNLLPYRVLTLPIEHLEAFQAGPDTYTHLGGLTAVPANALVTLDGRHLCPASDRLSDLLVYLGQAHTYLHGLTKHHQLAALAHR